MDFEMMQHLVPFVIVVAIGAVLHGFSGFGFGLVSMSMFALLGLPIERASSLLTIIAIPLFTIFSISELRRTRPKALQTTLILVGMVAGIPIGYSVIFQYGDTILFSIGFGIFILGVATWQLANADSTTSIAVGWGPLFGFIGGFLGGAVVSGGPAVVVYLYANSEDPRDQKCTAQIVFLSSAIVRLIVIGHGVAGLSWEMVGLGILVLPLPIIIILIANRFSRLVSVERFRRFTNYFLFCIGVAMLLQPLFRL